MYNKFAFYIRMRNLFETEYTVSSNSNILCSISNNNIKSSIWSILDTDFDEDEEDIDELELYILKKPANKEIDVLAW